MATSALEFEDQPSEKEAELLRRKGGVNHGLRKIPGGGLVWQAR